MVLELGRGEADTHCCVKARETHLKGSLAWYRVLLVEMLLWIKWPIVSGRRPSCTTGSSAGHSTGVGMPAQPDSPGLIQRHWSSQHQWFQEPSKETHSWRVGRPCSLAPSQPFSLTTLVQPYVKLTLCGPWTACNCSSCFQASLQGQPGRALIASLLFKNHSQFSPTAKPNEAQISWPSIQRPSQTVPSQPA